MFDEIASYVKGFMYIYALPTFCLWLTINRTYKSLFKRKTFIISSEREIWLSFNIVLAIIFICFSYNCIWPNTCGKDMSEGFNMLGASLWGYGFSFSCLLEYFTSKSGDISKDK